MQGFSWVLFEKLAGLPRPGSFESLDEDAAFLKGKGVTLLVSLTESAPNANTLAAHDIASIHLPIQDFTPPSPEQLERFVKETDVAIASNGRVGVHCAAGRGRTGTMLAAYFVSQGQSAREAIEKVRHMRPGSIETHEQEACLAAFEDRLRTQA